MQSSTDSLNKRELSDNKSFNAMLKESAVDTAVRNADSLPSLNRLHICTVNTDMFGFASAKTGCTYSTRAGASQPFIFLKIWVWYRKNLRHSACKEKGL